MTGFVLDIFTTVYDKIYILSLDNKIIFWRYQSQNSDKYLMSWSNYQSEFLIDISKNSKKNNLNVVLKEKKGVII